jgi:23S rRNA (pseudouridine1915-N3)-methyltransferase
MKIIILTVGKSDENFYLQIIQEYLKRISKFCPISLESIQEQKYNNKFSLQEALKAESYLIEQKLNRQDFVVILDEKGKQFSSVEFSMQINKWLSSSNKRIIFIIGGAYGIDEDFKNKYFKLSLSNYTFNHQLIRIMLLEQIYRAFTIIKGIPYHK